MHRHRGILKRLECYAEIENFWSEIPWAHGIPHEITPMRVSPLIKGPPLSPMQVLEIIRVFLNLAKVTNLTLDPVA